MNTLLNNSHLLRVALYFLIYLIPVSGFAQAPDYTRVYHPVINSAEESILSNDYANALIAYKQAFASVPEPFVRDYFNAAACALVAGEDKQAFKYLESLTKKGVSLSYLEKQEAFTDVKSSRRWKKFVRKYPKYRKKYREAVNEDLRADLDELYARDQYFRQAKGGYRVYGDTLKKIEDANTQRFLKWVEQYGYPSEGLIGVADSLEQLPRFYIIIERQTKARNGYDFTNMLKEAVEQGKLSPQTAAYLLDKQAGENKYGSKAIVKLNCTTCGGDKQQDTAKKYFAKARTAQELEQINERREQLGLDTVEEYLLKVLYGMEDKRFKLATDWAVTNYYVPSREAANVMMESLMTIDYSYQQNYIHQK